MIDHMSILSCTPTDLANKAPRRGASPSIVLQAFQDHPLHCSMGWIPRTGRVSKLAAQVSAGHRVDWEMHEEQLSLERGKAIQDAPGSINAEFEHVPSQTDAGVGRDLCVANKDCLFSSSYCLITQSLRTWTNCQGRYCTVPLR